MGGKKDQPTKAAPGKDGPPAGQYNHRTGDILFYEGDPGGDLFFIEDGEIEIFTKKDHQEIILSRMKRGEIIGVMTCMTSEPRMASARACTPVVCKKVPHESIKKVLAALPNWMKIVIKEFSLRLTQMNAVYSESVLKVRKLSENQVDSLFLGAQISAGFAAISEYFAIQGDNYKIVVIEDVLSKLETVLNIEKSRLDRIFAVILEAGLLKVEMEPDKRRTVSQLENAQKLAYFAQFIKESKAGPTKKYVRARFTNKETRTMSGLVKLAVRMDSNLEKPCRFKIADLNRTLERSTGVKFEQDSLKKGEDLKLLTIEGEDPDAEVVFRPSHLGRTVACIEAVRKLQAFDGSVDEDKKVAA
jgi:CRP-like cAMP-binding protein